MPFTQSHGASLAATVLLGASITASLLFGLTACTSDQSQTEPKPRASSSNPSEPSATEPPSPNATTDTAQPPEEITPPVKPEAMKHNTEEGAIAFTNYFLDVYEYMMATLDPQLFAQISDPACKTCSQILTTVEEYRVKGLAVSGFRVKGRNTMEIGVAGPESYGVVGNLVQSRYVLTNKFGEDVRTTSDSQFEMGLISRFENGNWKTVQFGSVTE